MSGTKCLRFGGQTKIQQQMCAEEKETENVRELSSWKERLKRHVPILKWFPRHQKVDFLADAIAGLTVGLTLIPQSVAYAGLAGLSPEYGLYSSFMGSFIYVVFGTIKEVSMGPTSLLCLLTFEFTKDLPMEFVFLLSLMCGVVEILLSLLRFGFLVNFISVPVTTSFQSATSLIIISTQMKDLLGVSKFKSGRFLNNISAVAERLQETRMGDVALSVFCCAFLLLLRKLKDVNISKGKELTGNERTLKKALWFISISRNALCVLLSCVLAYVFSLYGNVPFKLSGNLPSGLPPFRLPQFSIRSGNETLPFTDVVYQIGYGALVIPLISITANVTIGKAFSEGGQVDATQEMLTLGLCNIGGSFVSSLPTCGAFTRSAVSNSSGVRSPLAGFFTGTLVILVVKFLTPYFYYIPKATLASVLVCAVLFMIDWRTILLLWKVNKIDFLCSITTFSACLMLGIQVGLLFGVVVNAGHLLYIWAKPSISVEAKATADGSYYRVTPDIGLYFPATDFVRNTIAAKCVQSMPIVIDCVHFKGIDYTTAKAVQELGEQCRKRGQKLIFVNMRPSIYAILKNSNVNVRLRYFSSDSEDLNKVIFFSDEQEPLSAVLTESEVGKSSFEEKPLLKS